MKKKQANNSLQDKFSTLSYLKLKSGKTIAYYSLPLLKDRGLADVSNLPFSIRIVLESLLRNVDEKMIKKEDVLSLADWNYKTPLDRDIPFKVSRVLMQDFTGVPAVVDLAAMRDFITKTGKSGSMIQPEIPVDLIIDHSVQVDFFNNPKALELNQKREIERNKERYELLKWASISLNEFRVFPPSAGICHQVNLEFLATCVTVKKDESGYLAFPDTLVGTDSHTTMVDSLGIVGFGVGGIEAEAALLGQPVSFVTPKVLGVNLKGKLNDGVTATDFALTLTRLLREKGVVNMFVEFFGDGLTSLSLPDRATLSNMCPEYGATIAIFPVDEQTFEYLRMTGRKDEQIELVREYYKAQEMLNIDYSKVNFSDIIEVDLGSIAPCVSGPSQPKQEVPLDLIQESFNSAFMLPEKPNNGGHKLTDKDYTRWSSESMTPENGGIKDAPTHIDKKSVKIKYPDGYEVTLSDGDVVISSITSCTNTSNPSVMIAAGLLAKKALDAGLKIDTRKVKTSLGPGSRVVIKYLEKAGLLEPLAKLGYSLAAFGCITCIGNSGPLIDLQSAAINSNNLSVASVLSGNRNYEARIHRDIRANYLMSPPLVVAFGIAGTVLKDITKEPIGVSDKGKEVYLKDIWPSQEEVKVTINKVLSESMFDKEYGENIFKVNKYWNSIESAKREAYAWNNKSTYIKLPPFFNDFKELADKDVNISNAAVLAIFGDSISTDHISPAGEIGEDSPAGKYLIEHGVKPQDFNTYGSRRGNHEVMMRGTFANNRIKNFIIPGTEGGYTLYFPQKEKMTIYDAAMKYKQSGTSLIIIAGREYGSGSSRDWAAKGPALLGVKAVVAKSFERIHRSNLIGMGIFPLQFKNEDGFETLKIDVSKPISIEPISALKPRQDVKMTYFRSDNGNKSEVMLLSRIDSEMELEYYKSGGILNYVIKSIGA